MPDPAPPHILHGSTGLAELGAQMRAEWRADEAMWTRVAAQRWVHGRSIADVVREYAARGDRISLEVAGRTFDGVVESVGDDRIDLATDASRVTVRTALADSRGTVCTPVTIRRSARARAGGRRLPPALATFRARLLELEDPHVVVRIGVFMTGAEYVGPIVVGRDHVIVGGDVDVVVPAGWVAYVAEASRGVT